MSSSHNLEEDQESSPLGDEALQKANDYIKELFGILKQETNKVRKEKEAFDEMAKKLEHVHFSKMLKLNVGGHRFETSLETLTKYPGKLASRFEIMAKVQRAGGGLVERILGVSVLLGLWDAYPTPCSAAFCSPNSGQDVNNSNPILGFLVSRTSTTIAVSC